jgi:hypothetical protein
MEAETLSPIELINPDDLVAEIDLAAHLLRVSRECGFSDLVAKIEGDIQHNILPVLVVLRRCVDDELRDFAEARYRRLVGMLP